MTDNLLSALAIAAFIWDDQLSVLLMVTPRCVCWSTSDMTSPFKNRSGWFCRFRFLEIIMYSVLIALKIISHCFPKPVKR